MSKYNVGDVVKLRDDLKDKRFDTMKNTPIIIKNKSYFTEAYIIQDERKEWYINDEMIEGLWEECKSSEQVSKSEDKLRLIDILNKIANGELKEGTIVKCNGYNYEYRKLHRDSGKNTLDLYSEHNASLINTAYLTTTLSLEVELIEPDHFGKADKMAEPTDNTKIEELDKDDVFFLTEYQAIDKTIDKLNEVIRVINKE